MSVGGGVKNHQFYVVKRRQRGGRGSEIIVFETDNPICPIDAKNSIGFLVPFFWGKPGLLGDSEDCTSQ